MNQVISLTPAHEPAMLGQALLVPPDRVDLRGSLAFFKRRLRMIALIVALALAIGFALTVLQPKVYSAMAVVSLEPPAEEAQSGTVGVSGPSLSSSFVDTQVEIIKSQELSRRVASELGLLAGKDPEEQATVVNRLQRNVSANRSGSSYALNIWFSAGSGQEAAATADEFARQFTAWEMVSSRERNSSSIQLVGGRLEKLRRAAHADTQAVQQYRIANDLLSTSGASLTEQEISSYNQEVSRARAEAAQDQARLNTARAQLSSGSSGDDVGEALGSSVITGLRGRESQLAGEVANMKARYGPNHPQLVRAEAELASVGAQIQAEIGRVVSNLEARREVSAQRLASLTGSLGSARAQLTRNNAAMVGLDELERKAEASKALYETYLNGYKQLVAREGTEQPNARILSLAETPRLPTSPDLTMNLLLALVIGLGVGIAAAYTAESLVNGIRDSDELERSLGIRALGSIPLLSSVSQRRSVWPAVLEEPRSAFAEAFRGLRISIDQSLERPPQVLAVTSALPKEGKTTVSACLAQVLAQSSGSTVLVDCDLWRAGVSRLLDVDGERPGLMEVIEGKVALDDALVQGPDGLTILPMKLSNSHPEPLLTGRIFAALLHELRARYDFVVLDLPPVLPIAAARTIANRADATVMVVRWRKTGEQAVRSALARLPREHVRIAGAVLNKVDMSRRHLISRSDAESHYKSYKKYYT